MTFARLRPAVPPHQEARSISHGDGPHPGAPAPVPDLGTRAARSAAERGPAFRAEAPVSLLAWAEARSPAHGPHRMEDRPTGVPILLPLQTHRHCPAEIWAAVAGPESAVTAVLDLPPAEIDDAVAALARAGVRMLGRVDLEHGERPVTALLEDVAGWARHPVAGLLLERCPAEAEELGAVALAVREARRLGLAEVLLNPGTHPHPRYRCLGTEIVGFAGSWLDYQRAQTRPGDGHLVFDVPTALLPLARRLIALRGAGWALATPVAAPTHRPAQVTSP
jgi:hypothetical protein